MASTTRGAEGGISITGMAHLILVVKNWEATTAFYRRLLGFLGMTAVSDSERGLGQYDNEPFLYFVGGKTALGFHRADSALGSFDQSRAGMHHYCLRARSAADVDRVQQYFDQELVPLGGKLVRRAAENKWAPGYYSILFEDPDGMRGEVNYVPGKGLLAMERPEVGYGDQGLGPNPDKHNNNAHAHAKL